MLAAIPGSYARLQLPPRVPLFGKNLSSHIQTRHWPRWQSEAKRAGTILLLLLVLLLVLVLLLLLSLLLFIIIIIIIIIINRPSEYL